MNCDASALRGQLLGAGALEPAVANRSATACRTASSPSGLDLSSLGLPLTGGLLGAATFASGTADAQRALALGGVANLHVGALSGLGIALPDLTQYLPASLSAVHLDLAGGLTGGLLSTLNLVLTPLGLALPSSIDVDVAAAARGLLPAVTGAPLLGVDAATAYAGAQCKDGRAVPFGTSSVAGVKVLGQDLGADGVLNGVLPVISGGQIDLSKLDVTQIALPKVLTDLLPRLTTLLRTTLLTQVQGLLSTTLAALPKIPIPAQLLQVDVRPAVQTVSGGVLTQQALRVHLALLGQTVVDAVLGEARVSTDGVDCTPAPVGRAGDTTAADLVLQCTKRRLVLTDVYRRGDRVRLEGVADRRYVGRRLALRFEADHRVVAHATVRADGSFAASAHLPKRALRASNRARYRAELGSQRSLNLKLQRRMLVTSMTVRGGKVRIRGRISRPLGSPVQAVHVQRRVSCSRNETVRTIRPHRDGTFSVTVEAPGGQSAAVYRLATKVRKTERNRKLFPTYTLPRAIDLAG